MERTRKIIGGATRSVVRVNCRSCGKPTSWVREDHFKKRKKGFYCSLKCVGEANKRGRMLPCSQCGVHIYRRYSASKSSKSGLFFCSRSCRSTHFNPILFSGPKSTRWKGGVRYRRRALDHYGRQCSNVRCPIIKPIDERLLDVDHIDGNRSNNCLTNLQVLCVFCHAVKTRIGARGEIRTRK